MWPEPEACDKTCNYLLNIAKTAGGPRAGQDKEKVDLWDKCLLSSAECQFRSNNDLCWTLETEIKEKWAGGQSACVDSVEEPVVGWRWQLDIDQTRLCLQAEIKVQDLGLMECSLLAD